MLSCCSCVSSDGNSIFMFWGNKHLSFQIEELLLVSSWLQAQIQVSPSSLSYGEAGRIMKSKPWLKMLAEFSVWGLQYIPALKQSRTPMTRSTVVCVFCTRVLYHCLHKLESDILKEQNSKFLSSWPKISKEMVCNHKNMLLQDTIEWLHITMEKQIIYILNAYRCKASLN